MFQLREWLIRVAVTTRIRDFLHDAAEIFVLVIEFNFACFIATFILS